ncbi:hypothetical protein TNCV_787771 [Trichonephila clavipes]|nr:hypothetical protein TNCV_787771 [Trichonephila clavipes]
MEGLPYCNLYRPNLWRPKVGPPRTQPGVSALDRFNVHHCPTRRVFSGTGLELVTRQATILQYLDHSATAATRIIPKSDNKSRETKQLRNSKGKKTSYSAKTYNDQTEKIENLEKKFAKLELKFEENNNIFEKKLEQIVQRFTTELNTVVAQINFSFSSLMNTVESTLTKVASNITIPKDDDCLINRKQNEKSKKIRGNTLESVVEKNKEI